MPNTSVLFFLVTLLQGTNTDLADPLIIEDHFSESRDKLFS